MNGTQALHQALDQALAGTHPDLTEPVHMLGEALELSPATTGLLARYPDRVHLLPSADAALVGVAIGLAMTGSIAVVELADPTALVGALPQLVEAASLGTADCPLHVIVRVPVGPDTSPLLTHVLGHAMPGLAVASPSTPSDVGPLLTAAMAWPGPVLLLEPRTVLCDHDATLADPLPLGRARLLRQGRHATVLAFGQAVRQALQAADLLADEGIEIDVVDLRSLTPMDTLTIGQTVQRTGRAIVAGAVGVLTAAVQNAFLHLEAPPVQVSEPTDAAAIAAAVRGSVHY